MLFWNVLDDFLIDLNDILRKFDQLLIKILLNMMYLHLLNILFEYVFALSIRDTDKILFLSFLLNLWNFCIYCHCYPKHHEPDKNKKHEGYYLSQYFDLRKCLFLNVFSNNRNNNNNSIKK